MINVRWENPPLKILPHPPLPKKHKSIRARYFSQFSNFYREEKNFIIIITTLRRREERKEKKTETYFFKMKQFYMR